MAWSWMLVTPVLVSQWRNGSTEQAWRSPCHSDFLLGGPDLRLFLRLLDLPSLSSQSLQQKAQGALPSLCARCECPCSSSSLGKQQEVFDCCSALYNPAIPTPTWTPCDWRNVVGICSSPLRHKRHPKHPSWDTPAGKKAGGAAWTLSFTLSEGNLRTRSDSAEEDAVQEWFAWQRPHCRSEAAALQHLFHWKASKTKTFASHRRQILNMKPPSTACS